jgi:hypothetical protein
MILPKITVARSDDALVNNIFNQIAHFLSDVGKLRGVPKGSKEERGFVKFSKLFCDSMIFWCVYNHADDKNSGTAIGKYIGELRDAFGNTTLVAESVKMTHRSLLDANDETISEKTLKRHRKEVTGKQYTAGIIAIKVSLQYSKAKKVVPTLAYLLPQLKKKCIVLHDIDFARDCSNITTRTHLENLIKANKAGKILDDRRRVGHHCISWKGKTDETENIRFKVYNKLVQVLESAEVRKTLGSRMEDLVEKDSTFARRIERRREHGYTRIELTFYGAHLLSLEEYAERMDETREFLKKCPTFQCSFEKQWEERAKCISTMVAVYITRKESRTNEGVFAYCHWWNSVTSKKYGYMWKRVSPETAQLLLANYSFNDRPIHYLEASVEKGEYAEITRHTTYKREPGCTAITMVPGPQKGMFPAREDCPDGVYKFHQVGIVEVDNIRIGWPKRTHTRDSNPVAEIFECEDDSENTNVLHLKTVHVSMYTAVDQVLQLKTKYTIVAAGYQEYRGDHRWHFITKCGLKIRAGKSLDKIWREWRRFHVDRSEKIGSVAGVPFMDFRALKIVRSRGTYDMQCEVM